MARERVLFDITDSVMALRPDSRVSVFGSFPAGLSTFISDLDLSILLGGADAGEDQRGADTPAIAALQGDHMAQGQERNVKAATSVSGDTGVVSEGIRSPKNTPSTAGKMVTSSAVSSTMPSNRGVEVEVGVDAGYSSEEDDEPIWVTDSDDDEVIHFGKRAGKGTGVAGHAGGRGQDKGPRARAGAYNKFAREGEQGSYESESGDNSANSVAGDNNDNDDDDDEIVYMGHRRRGEPQQHLEEQLSFHIHEDQDDEEEEEEGSLDDYDVNKGPVAKRRRGADPVPVSGRKRGPPGKSAAEMALEKEVAVTLLRKLFEAFKVHHILIHPPYCILPS